MISVVRLCSNKHLPNKSETMNIEEMGKGYFGSRLTYREPKMAGILNFYFLTYREPKMAGMMYLFF